MSLFTQFWLAACFSALLICPSGAADDDADEGSSPIEKPTVIELTPDNFNELVEESDEYWIVEFFAPWCGHCKKLAPEYEKASKQLAGVVRLGAVDADAHPTLGAQFGVKGFPTLKAFPDSATLNPYTKKFGRQAVEYSGARTAKGIVAYAKANMPSLVKEVAGDGDHKSFVEEKGMPKALLFTDKKETPPTFKALSLRFKDRMRLGQVGSESKAILEKYAVDAFPRVVVLPADGSPPVVWDGENKLEALHAFFAKHANANKPAAPGAPRPVDELSDESFASSVLTGNATWIVHFHAAERISAFAKVAKELHGMGLRFGELSVSADAKLLSKFKIKALPAVAIFSAYDKDEAERYTGADDVEKLRSFAEEAIPSAVEHVGAQGLELLFRNNPAVPKIIMFSRKDEVLPSMKACSTTFKGKLMFAQVTNPPPELLQQFGIPAKGKWPKLIAMFLVPDQKEPDGPAKVQGALYQGDVTRFDTMATWLSQFIAADEIEAGPTSLDVAHVNDAAGFKKHCADKGGLCAIAMLNGAPSADAEREAQLEMLKRVASRPDSKAFTIVWADATCQAAFSDAFNVQSTKVPTMVIVSPKKLRYAEMVGRFEEDAIKSFLAGVLHGKIKTGPISVIPEPETNDCAAVHKLNAEAAVEAPVEEDAEADALMREMLAEAEAKAKAAAAEAEKDDDDDDAPKKSRKGKKKK